jgi:hypothetical protein
MSGTSYNAKHMPKEEKNKILASIDTLISKLTADATYLYAARENVAHPYPRSNGPTTSALNAVFANK